MLQVKKILLTGSSGFIGSQLLKHLSKNYKIFVTLRKKNKFFDKNINKIFFKNYKQLNKKLKKIKVDYVIHCATHYIKKHKTEDIIDWCITNEPKLSNDKFVQPPQCMPIEYKSRCSIKAYRTYYLNDKKGFLDYKKREMPQWIKFDK